MMNEVSHNAAPSNKSFIVILGFGSGIPKLSLTACHQARGAEDTLAHDELDAAYRDMCRDITPLVPHQLSAKPQDVPLLCSSALFLPTSFQSILIILWPGIQFVPAILCGGL